ncbi:hypothetical protein ACLOJK_019436, partial [Asimina triloba]
IKKLTSNPGVTDSDSYLKTSAVREADASDRQRQGQWRMLQIGGDRGNGEDRGIGEEKGEAEAEGGVAGDARGAEMRREMARQPERRREREWSVKGKGDCGAGRE